MFHKCGDIEEFFVSYLLQSISMSTVIILRRRRRLRKLLRFMLGGDY